MKVHLSRITSAGTRHAFALAARKLPRLAEELAEEEAPGTVEADLVLKSLPETILVGGTVRGDFVVPCARCLAPVRIVLEEEITAVQASVSQMRRLEPERQLSSSDLDIAYFSGEEIDLTELVEEQVLLMLPRTAYCRDDCQGLCVRCGANLNEGRCSCQPETAHHPFAAMKDLLSDPPG